MKQDIQIYIGGEQVDIIDVNSIGLSLSFAIADINDIGSRQGGRSKTIKLPATAKNKKIFGFIEDVNTSDGVDQRQKPTARIEVAGTPEMVGYVKMAKPIYQGTTRITGYEIIIYGDNGDWINKIRYKKLTDLDYSDQDHLYTASVQIESETIAPGRHYVYDMADRGQFLSDTLYTTGWVHGVGVQDRYPAISVRSFVDKILKPTGLKLVSAFLDSDFFKRLYIPFANGVFKHPSTWRNTQLFKALSVGDYITAQGAYYQEYITTSGILDNYIDFRSEVFDTSNNYFPDNGNWSFYRVPSSGKYKFNLSLRYAVSQSVSNTTGSIFFNIYKRNGQLDYYDQVIFQKTIAWSNGANGTLVFNTDFLNLVYGDEIYVGVSLALTMSSTVEHKFVIWENSFFECINIEDGQLAVNPGQPVVMNENLPANISQLEFLMGLKDLFHLYFYCDTEGRTLYCEPRDEFYYKDKFHDWTKKLDKKQPVESNFLGDAFSKKIRYAYKKDSSDAIVKGWEEENNERFASYTVELANQFARDGIEDNNCGVFHPTWMAPCPRIGLATAEIPKMWTSATPIPPKNTGFGLRILYYAGVVNAPSGEGVEYQDEAGVKYARYNYPYFYSTNYKEDNDNNLWFSDNEMSYGLWHKHYKNFHKVIDESRIVTAFFNLTDTDIANIDFRMPIYFEVDGSGAFYFLNKIPNYKPALRQTTEVELIKVVGDAPKKVLSKVVTKVVTEATPVKAEATFTQRTTTGDTQLVDSSTSRVLMTFKQDGSIQEGSRGEMFTEVDGILQPMYYIDADNNYQKMML